MNVDLTGKRIALIGGAGFIGHNLALKLISLGADVHVFDGLQVNNLGAFSNVVNDPLKLLYLHLINERIELMRKNSIPLHVLDARDYQTLSRSLSEIKPQVVVQLAAIAHANRANKDPFSTFDHSFRTLENALDCAAQCHRALHLFLLLHRYTAILRAIRSMRSATANHWEFTVRSNTAAKSW